MVFDYDLILYLNDANLGIHVTHIAATLNFCLITCSYSYYHHAQYKVFSIQSPLSIKLSLKYNTTFSILYLWSRIYCYALPM